MVYSLRTHGFGMQGSGFGRGVRHFGRHTNMNVSIFNNRTTIINTCNHGFGGFSGFGFGGMGLFSGLFSMFQQFPMFQFPMFQFPMFQQAAPAAPAPQTTPPPATEVKTEVEDKEVETTAAEESPETDGAGGYACEVKKEEDKISTYKIVKGDTWWEIAQTKYDIPDGVRLKDVYKALEKANYNGNDFETAMHSAHGIQFYPGNQIKLPSPLTINGHDVKLYDDHESREPAHSNNTFEASPYRSAKVTFCENDTWSIFSNGQKIRGGYNTEDEANSAANTFRTTGHI